MEEVEKSTEGFLKGNNGNFSMRRLLALVFGIASIAAGILSIVFTFLGTKDMDKAWLVIFISFASPGLISALFMFFTSWESIATVVQAARK